MEADRNVVISLERYNEMEKELRNTKYLEKLAKAYNQLQTGEGRVHDLIETED